MPVLPSQAPLRRLLVECVKRTDAPEAPAALERPLPVDLAEGLVQAAVAHRVAGCLYRSLRRWGISAPHPLGQLRNEYRRAVMLHFRALADVKASGEILDGAGIPWLLVKGPVLSEAYYGDPGLRSYLDVDLLVRPRDLRRALTAFESAGCPITQRCWTPGPKKLPAEVTLFLPNGSPGDLHWHLLNDAGLRRCLDLPVERMFDRPRSLELAPGLKVATLDPEDTLIHLALHAMMSGGNRLVWMKDLERAAAAGPNWDVVVERTRSARAELPVGTMLARSHATLGSQVPVEVLRALAGGRAWARVAGAAEHLSRFARPVYESPASRVVRSSRHNLAATAGQLGFRAVRGTGRVLRRSLLAEPGAGRPQGTRSAFCDAVERADLLRAS